MPIDKSIFSKVRKIQIKTSRVVTEVFSGEYRSVFKGRGMEFAEVREYQPGDEVRSIDWNVTARMNRPFVKEFTEERELTVFFVVDVSSSMGFGSRERTKKELVAELCAVLAFAAIENKDKVGVILFSDRIEKYIPPAKGKRHVLRVIRELLSAGSEKKEETVKTDLGLALEYLGKVQRKRAVCFILSDFFSAGYEKTLNVATRKHDLVALRIEDRLEDEIPKTGLLTLEDLETGEQILADFSDKTVVARFKELTTQRNLRLAQSLKSKRIDLLTIRTGEDYVKAITRFFREREKRIKK